MSIATDKNTWEERKDLGQKQLEVAMYNTVHHLNVFMQKNNSSP